MRKTVGDNNQQATLTLPKYLMDLLDRDAEAGYRSRSQQMLMIIQEYYRNDVNAAKKILKLSE